MFCFFLLFHKAPGNLPNPFGPKHQGIAMEKRRSFPALWRGWGAVIPGQVASQAPPPAVNRGGQSPKGPAPPDWDLAPAAPQWPLAGPGLLPSPPLSSRPHGERDGCMLVSPQSDNFFSKCELWSHLKPSFNKYVLTPGPGPLVSGRHSKQGSHIYQELDFGEVTPLRGTSVSFSVTCLPGSMWGLAS